MIKREDYLSALYIALRQEDFTITPKRQEVIAFIYERKELEDIEMAWIKLRQSSKVSWATMHGTVRLLVRLGWLKVDDTGRKRRYIIQQVN